MGGKLNSTLKILRLCPIFILMKRLIITIAMLLVVALAIGQSAVKKGLSLGGIYIGDSKREVLTKYGQPDEKDCDRWVYDFNKCKFSVEFDDDGVSLLAVHGELDRASSFKTRLGVRLGDKEATLIKAYGKGTLEYDGAATRIRMYPNFNAHIDTANKIYLMEIYKK